MPMVNDELLEPVKAYNAKYKESFQKNSEELFDKLVKDSGIKADENRKVAEEYRQKQAEYNNQAQILASKKRLKGFLIFLVIVAFLASIILFATIGKSDVPALNIILAILCVALGVGGIFLIIQKFNPEIKVLSEQADALFQEAKQLYEQAIALIRPLFGLFDDCMMSELIDKTIPLLKLDPYYNMRRYDYLHGKYGLEDEYNPDTSVEGVLSGEILGNPFLFVRKLHYYMGTQTYHGSISISWTETETDSEGHPRTVTRSETLSASVTKPKPYYYRDVYLIYGNDAAPDLVFTHAPSHAEQMDEKKIERVVKSKMKKVRKEAKKNMSFTEMDNEEFEALFDATDRNNEVQFRLLFTPLAQKNMLNLMKGELPTGDDFHFIKDKCLNMIKSEHIQKWDLNLSPCRFFSYDIDLLKKEFVDSTLEDFRMIFFEFAPLLSIPLYQQIKPREYIYQQSYHRHFPIWQTETMANQFAEADICHPLTVTPSIRKTEFLGKTEHGDKVCITAESFHTIPRTDYISVHGGDGFSHDVPVEWDEYVPLSKSTEMELENTNETRHDFFADSNYTDRVNHSTASTYSNRILAILKPYFEKRK